MSGVSVNGTPSRRCRRLTSYPTDRNACIPPNECDNVTVMNWLTAPATPTDPTTIAGLAAALATITAICWAGIHTTNHPPIHRAHHGMPTVEPHNTPTMILLPAGGEGVSCRPYDWQLDAWPQGTP